MYNPNHLPCVWLGNMCLDPLTFQCMQLFNSNEGQRSYPATFYSLCTFQACIPHGMPLLIARVTLPFPPMLLLRGRENNYAPLNKSLMLLMIMAMSLLDLTVFILTHGKYLYPKTSTNDAPSPSRLSCGKNGKLPFIYEPSFFPCLYFDR